MGNYLPCSHILNIHQEAPSKHKGNLYLSSVYSLDSDDLNKDFQINCVLTIMDSASLISFKVKEKV